MRKLLWEVWVRKGEASGVFTPKGQDQPFIGSLPEALAIAKACVEEGGGFEEAIVLERREIRRFLRA